MRWRAAFLGLVVAVTFGSASATPAPGARHAGTNANHGRPLLAAGNAGTFATLYAFGGQPDGANPKGGVLIDGSGNIFGNTVSGGANNSGSIYELSPSRSGYAGHIILSYSATHDGDQPIGVLATDKQGDLFGMAPYGGRHDDGTAVELTPAGSGTYNESAAHSFMGSDGELPFGGMVRSGSTFYATTSDGGLYHLGTIVSITGAHLRSSVLYSFGGPVGDGWYPDSPLAQGGKGSYFGTTSSAPSGNGTVFTFAPGSTGVSTLYTFEGTNDGVGPTGVISDGNGNLFGTTNQGGAAGAGIVYELTPGAGGYTEHILHTFTGASGDGRFPQETPVLVGNTLYGTTTTGGSGACGTIFKVTITGKKYAVVYNFQCGNDGGAPTGNLLWAKGAIYGVAAAGGAGNNGLVYAFKP
jgi:uncharacterized repeat protein (TIGR03803 family)